MDKTFAQHYAEYEAAQSAMYAAERGLFRLVLPVLLATDPGWKAWDIDSVGVYEDCDKVTVSLTHCMGMSEHEVLKLSDVLDPEAPARITAAREAKDLTERQRQAAAELARAEAKVAELKAKQ